MIKKSEEIVFVFHNSKSIVQKRFSNDDFCSKKSIDEDALTMFCFTKNNESFDLISNGHNGGEQDDDEY